MTWRERWRKTTIANQMLVIVGGVAAGGTLLSAAFTAVSLYLVHASGQQSAQQMAGAIASLKDTADALRGANANQLLALNDGAAQANRGLDAAQEQGKLALDAAAGLARGQIAAQRAALDLDQRPWLGIVGYVIQSRANAEADWTSREPERNDQFRIRFQVNNSGKTPAVGVWNEVTPLRIVGNAVPVPAPPEWSEVKGDRAGTVVFPGDSGRFQDTAPFRAFTENEFSAYTKRLARIYIWLRIYYCDGSQRRHWSDVGVSHEYRQGPAAFNIILSRVSPVIGERHKDCD